MRIEYKLKAIGGQLSSIPGLAGMIESTVHGAIESTLMWPERIVVPLCPSFDASCLAARLGTLCSRPSTLLCQSAPPLIPGSLVVTAWKAEGLKNVDMMSVSDPFAILWTHCKHKAVTRTIDNDLNPVWNETFELPVDDIHTAELFIQVEDEDSFGTQNLGYAMYPLVGLLDKDTVQTVTLTLLPKLNNDRMLGIDHKLGSITLQLNNDRMLGMDHKLGWGASLCRRFNDHKLGCITLQMVYRSYTPEEKVLVTAAEKALGLMPPSFPPHPTPPSCPAITDGIPQLHARGEGAGNRSGEGPRPQGGQKVRTGRKSGDGGWEAVADRLVESTRGRKLKRSFQMSRGSRREGGGEEGEDEEEEEEEEDEEEEEEEEGSARVENGEGERGMAGGASVRKENVRAGGLGAVDVGEGRERVAAERGSEEGGSEEGGSEEGGSEEGGSEEGGSEEGGSEEGGVNGACHVAGKRSEGGSAVGRGERSWKGASWRRRGGTGRSMGSLEEVQGSLKEVQGSAAAQGSLKEVQGSAAAREAGWAGAEGIRHGEQTMGGALLSRVKSHPQGMRNGERKMGGGESKAGGGLEGEGGRDGQANGVGGLVGKRDVRRILLGGMQERKDGSWIAHNRTLSADAAGARNTVSSLSAGAGEAAFAEAAYASDGCDAGSAGDGGDGGGVWIGHGGEGGGVRRSHSAGGWDAVLECVVESVREKELKRSLQMSRKWRKGGLAGEEDGEEWEEEEEGEEKDGEAERGNGDGEAERGNGDGEAERGNGDGEAERGNGDGEAERGNGDGEEDRVANGQKNKEELRRGLEGGQASKIGGLMRRMELRNLLLGAMMERKDSPRVAGAGRARG
ncbi:unnamed protein product [Closterium sp. Yama58-4]|nr:unnamed protein product [Closterium sp. Yama58-4]